MSGVTVRGIRRWTEGTRCAAAARLETDGNAFELWFRWTGAPLPESDDAFVPTALLAAMRTGRPLRFEGEVSPRLLAALPRIQALLATWTPRLRVVPVEAQARLVPSPSSPRGTASFFSGGVDSYYTVLRHLDTLSHLIFVHGFDIRLDDLSLRSQVSEVIRQAAAELDRTLIEVETNLRDFTDPLLSWNWYHGAAMAAVALLLSSAASHIFLPATVAAQAPFPWGSHPLLDPQWSTEAVELISDGAVSRMEKVLFLSAFDLPLRTLRVCWENRDGAYNCGRCGKCLRAMLTLRAAGALERCSTFPRPLDLSFLSRAWITRFPISRADYEEIYRHVQASGADPELEEALRHALRRRDQRVRFFAANLRSRLHHLLRGSPDP